MAESNSALPLSEDIVAALEGFPRGLLDEDPADWCWEEVWQRTQGLLDCVECDHVAAREHARLLERRREIQTLDWLKTGLRRMSDEEVRPYVEPRRISDERNARLLGDFLAAALATRLWTRVDAFVNGNDPAEDLEALNPNFADSKILRALAAAANAEDDAGPALDAEKFLAADPGARPIFEDVLADLRRRRWKGSVDDLAALATPGSPLEELALRWDSFEAYGTGRTGPIWPAEPA